MALLGYLAFLDPPKDSAVEALKQLKALNVDVKILTGIRSRQHIHHIRNIQEQVTLFILQRLQDPCPRRPSGRHNGCKLGDYQRHNDAHQHAFRRQHKS
jgi:hypothetical protein